MQYLFMVLFAAGIVAADQLSKFWIANNIAPPLGMTVEQIEAMRKAFFLDDIVLDDLPETIKGIPNIFHLTHVHNEGAAFSSFEGMLWLFILIFAVFTGAIVWEFAKKKMPFSTFERWCIVGVFGGGLGNMIDRIRLGYVVDMIEVEFIKFPVFNVADCFITCGCIALMVSLVLFNKEFWKDEKKK